MINKNILFKKWTTCYDINEFQADIPSSLKRGLSDISKLALNSALKLHLENKSPVVCATRYGCQQQIFKIKEQQSLCDEFSPTIFSKLSNNIFGGILMILEQNNLPYTTISAGKQTFEMGLLESFLQINDRITYIYAEEKAPFPLSTLRRSKSMAFALNIENSPEGNFSLQFHNKINRKCKKIDDFIDFLNNPSKRFETNYFTIEKL